MLLNGLLLSAAVLINVNVCGCLDVGDKCQPNKDVTKGKCALVINCEPALRYIKIRRPIPFLRCGFRGATEIVCCPDHPGPTTSSGPVQDNRIDCKNIIENNVPPTGSYIIGGQDAQLGEFPHMVALGYLKDDVYDFSCGGTLISQYYVITAAHCVDNIEQTRPEIARFGVVEIGKDVFDPDTDIRIVKDIVHPNRTALYKYHDLALLRLAQPVKFTRTQFPACLPSDVAIPNTPLTVTGWGRVDVNRDIRSKILQKANVSVVDSSECEKRYTNWRKLSDGIVLGQFCAGDPQGRTDACQGDSGGPIQALGTGDGFYRLIGIISFGRGCGSSTPGVYTRVHPYLDWIESIVWPNGV